MKKVFCLMGLVGLFSFAGKSFAWVGPGLCKRAAVRAAFYQANVEEPAAYRKHLVDVYEARPQLYLVTISYYPDEVVGHVWVDSKCRVLNVEIWNSNNSSRIGGGG